MGFRVSGFRVWGLGVWGLGFEVSTYLCFWGLFRDIQLYIYIGLDWAYWDNGKEHGNYHLGLTGLGFGV